MESTALLWARSGGSYPAPLSELGHFDSRPALARLELVLGGLLTFDGIGLAESPRSQSILASWLRT